MPVDPLDVSRPELSIVLPARNEAAGIARSLASIAAVLEEQGVSFEIIVVDDGSSDATFATVAALAGQDPRLHARRLSRNFGKEAALLCGLRAARGQAVVTMDADLQHPPALLGEMIAAWRQGAQVVNAVKRDRARDSWWSRWRASLYNRLFSNLVGIDLRNASDYKLLDRTVVDVLIHDLPERTRFYRGLTSWVGFRQARVPFDVAARVDGHSQWSWRSLVGLALTALLAFTSAPLRLVTVLGLVTLAFAVIVGGEALWVWAHGRSVSGFTTLIFTLLILGSFIMISLGIVGEYLARIYEELKGRPTYLEAERTGKTDAPP